jgi:hypothetical protein
MATALTTRETAGAGATVKDAPLTNAEVDNNFISITNNKLEADNNLSDLTDTAAAKTNLDLATMAEQESNSVSITGGSISGVTLSSSNTTITGGKIGGIDSLGVNTTAPATTGEIRATGDIVSHFSSDIKNKENISDISDALETVTKIGGKIFDWKDEYINSRGGEDEYFVQKHDFGVIAQDVQGVFPLAVRERENGELAVDYVKLCSLAFAAIKELNEKVDSLITQQRNS